MSEEIKQKYFRTMSEEKKKKKKRWKFNFFSCQGQFELIGGLVDHRLY